MPELPEERQCRLCGYPFIAEEADQLYCSELCESTDQKIDEVEARREERA
jgi:predicted nucleic acid-binding Zn ribbon protein